MSAKVRTRTLGAIHTLVNRLESACLTNAARVSGQKEVAALCEAIDTLSTTYARLADAAHLGDELPEVPGGASGVDGPDHDGEGIDGPRHGQDTDYEHAPDAAPRARRKGRLGFRP
jgi:hypothetical protein